MSDASPPSALRFPLMVLAAAALCFAVGHPLASSWLTEVLGLLVAAGLTPVVTDLTAANRLVLGTALAFGCSGLLGGLAAWLLARVAGAAPKLAGLLRSTAAIFVGANLGVAAKTVTLARIAVPDAVERSVGGGGLSIDLASLQFAPWALSGAVLAFIVVVAVGAVFGILGRSRS